jgi:hypothetical protein
MFLLHSEINYFLDPINNSSILQGFPLKISGLNIEVDNEYSKQGKVISKKFISLRIKSN